MANYVSLSYGPTSYGRHPAANVTHLKDDTTFYLDLADVPGFPHLNEASRGRGDRPDRLLQKILNVNRAHPFILDLCETFAPLLLDHLISQLPALLAAATDPEKPTHTDT